MICFAFITQAQNTWQEKMFDRSANFYEIQADFEAYHDAIITESGSQNIPKGKGIK